MASIVLEKVVKELRLVKIVITLCCCGYGDRSVKLFSGHKPCYNSQ